MKHVDIVCCTLKLNRFQRKYVLHHLYTTRRVYIQMCQSLFNEYGQRDARSVLEVKGLMTQNHREYLKMMDDKEVECMLHDVLNYQWRLHHDKTTRIPNYYACIVTSHDLIWRNVSLKKMIDSSHGGIPNILYARLYYRHRQLHLDIRIRKQLKPYENDGYMG